MPATLADIQKIYGDEVYPPFKGVEPYMENENGIGYQGVILYNEVEDKIQCNECGEWFDNVGNHARLAHGIVAREYKDKNSLLYKTALVTPRLSRIFSKNAVARYKSNTNWGKRGRDIGHRRSKLEQVKTGKNASLVSRNKRNFQNAIGLCPAQIVQQLVIVRDELGKTSFKEVKMTDIYKLNKRLYSALITRYRSVSAITKFYGLAETNGKQYQDSELIAVLRNFVRQHKRLPKSAEMNCSPTTWVNRFGSWKGAMVRAGLDQLLVEVKQ